MNPILLKPVTNIGSQVIVNGEVLGNMGAADYFEMKKTLVPEIMRAYESLASVNDIIVIEGAGSPAEINLKSDDIVNMGMAKRAGAPVLLVGDIDRGGVFASYTPRSPAHARTSGPSSKHPSSTCSGASGTAGAGVAI
jgi:adenosylcobyric acid synthase